jgi:hypothetical protein
MSMLGGLGGSSDSSSYEPAQAPKAPRRSNKKLDNNMMRYYQKLKDKDSYGKSLLGGSAAAPTTSFSQQLFGSGGM